MTPIHVALVEDNQPLAAELEKWIGETPDLRCVGVYSSAEEALRLIATAWPNVLLVDLKLPGMGGVELIRHLKTRNPEVQCLVLTTYAETEQIFDAIKAGACGYLLKRIKPEEIAAAIRQTHAGGSVMTPRIARKVLEMFSGSNAPEHAPSEELHLTEREKQVLQCMVEGLPRKQIVEQLALNAHTLDYVIRRLYQKLHVRCLAAAVSVAVRQGIIQPKAGGSAT
jgi:DNA-binding NarL/FixJ family response regulator